MTPQEREVMQMALDALEQVQEADTAGATPKMVMEARKLYEPTITALRAALAQPEQEPIKHWSDCAVHNAPAYPSGKCDCGGFPVAWFDPKGVHLEFDIEDCFSFQEKEGYKPLYTAPPQREWQGLTDEEMEYAMPYAHSEFEKNEYREFASAIEAKLKEKNT